MRPLSSFRDPAPSRWAYRTQRLLLTPRFWFLLRTVLPVLTVAAAVAVYLSDADRREALAERAAEMRRQIEQRPEFMVELMAIEGASPEVADDLREILPIDFPVSSFDLDLGQIRLRVEELDAVARAAVRVRAGGVLEIDVTERVPAVVWRGRTGLELLDATGHRVAGLAARAERPDLPLLAGDGAPAAVEEALDLFRTANLIEPRIRGLLRVGERRWDVVLDRGQRILLPEAAPVPALERVIGLDQVRDMLDRDVVVVDMRTTGRPTLRLSADAAREFHDTMLHDIGGRE